MRLWIAEKPDAGRNIAKALGGGNESGGCIRLSSGDVVTWAIGHLLESYMPHDYDERYRKWDLGHLPIFPQKFLYQPVKDKASQLSIVTRLINQASEIVIATDAGREGEAIAWLVLEHAGWRGPAKRFWTSSLTPTSLAKAVNALIDDREKKGMYIAARLRASMDWSDGVNWSRYYNLRCNNYGDKPISLGRVQTATLALVVDRDLAIEAFKPSDYFELKASMDLPQGKLELFHAPQGDNRIVDRQQAEDIARRTRGASTTLKVEKKPKKFAPPPPYSLPELQMHTSSLWGWSSDKTLDVLQKLYEAGAVTYPRTDSGHLAEDMVNDMPKHLAALKKHEQYRDMASMTPTYRKSIFDDKKVGDHHGIITTEEAVNISRLGPDAEFLFDLVARRFLACLMPDAEGTATSIKAVIEGYTFATSGLIYTFAGWKAAWEGLGDPDDKKSDDQGPSDDPDGEGDGKKDAGSKRKLPPVTDGQPAIADRVDVLTKTTKPPAAFTEGTLIKAMMAAGAKNPDAEIRDLLSNGGLGTGATRQEIIKKLKLREFLRNQGKKLISSQRAREFMAIIRNDRNRLADVLATADLERELRLVEKDPAKGLDIWKRYASELHHEINRLVSGPIPRKLSPNPRNAPSNGRAAGARTGNSASPQRKKSGTGAKAPQNKSNARGGSPRSR